MYRFTETTKWADPWFRQLTPEWKCFWLFICDQCDNAGVWKVDMDLASFHIGHALSLDDAPEGLMDRLFSLKAGEQVWIRGFVPFQHRNGLDGHSKPQAQVRTLLAKYGLEPVWPGSLHSSATQRPAHTPQDTHQQNTSGLAEAPPTEPGAAPTSKKKPKGKKPTKTELARKVSAETTARFLRFWEAWPAGHKAGYADVLVAWAEHDPDDAMTDLIVAAVEKHKSSERWTKDDGRWIPNPGTYVRQQRWNDDYKAAVKHNGPAGYDDDDLAF